MQHPRSGPRGLSWSQTDDGANEVVVLAVRMRLVVFAGVIVLIVLVVGSTAAVFLILMDTAGIPVGGWLVILVGGGIGIVASIALVQSMRMRRRRWLIRIDSQSVSVRSARFEWAISLADVSLIRLRRRTDYARIVIMGVDGAVLPLLAGLGIAPEPGDTGAFYLPEFPPSLEARLRAAGLVERRSSRNPDLVDWVRSSRRVVDRDVRHSHDRRAPGPSDQTGIVGRERS